MWSLCLLLFGGAFGYTLPREGFPWGYTCLNGPNVWGQHFEECSGFTQSPISLPTAPAPTPPFLKRIEYQNVERNEIKLFEVRQENKAINVIYKGPEHERPSFTGSVFDDKKFMFDRFLVRVGETECSGSEHLINGTKFAGEAQSYYYDSKYKSFDEALKVPGGIAVISSILEYTDENLPSTSFFDDLPFISGTSKGIEYRKNLLANLPIFSDEDKNKRCTNCDYYFYEGSLTFPPCSEVAFWHVYMKTYPISKNHFAALRSVVDYEDKKPLVGNVRPAQPLNFRDVLQYRDGEEHKLPPPPQYPPQMPPHMMPPQGQVPEEFLRQMQQQPPAQHQHPDEFLRQMQQQQPPAQHQHLPPYPGQGRQQPRPRG